MFFSANMAAANINGPAIEIIFINELFFLPPFLGEIFIGDWCKFLLLHFIFDKSLENPLFCEIFFCYFKIDRRDACPTL